MSVHITAKTGRKVQKIEAVSTFPSLNKQAEKGWSYELSLMSNASSQ